MITVEEMMADYDWCCAWYEAQYDGYVGYFDFKGIKEDSLLRQVECLYCACAGENDGDDWLCLGKFKNGKFFKMFAGCDYTGWDRQASGALEIYDTYEELFSPNTLTPKEQGRILTCS